jgi:hypothetical protein
MTAGRRKTPQERKRQEYANERREKHGENDKSSRRNVPLKRARDHRAHRRFVRQALDAPMPAQWIDGDEIEVRTWSSPRREFRKWPSIPLPQVLSRQHERRRELDQLDASQRDALGRRRAAWWSELSAAHARVVALWALARAAINELPTGWEWAIERAVQRRLGRPANWRRRVQRELRLPSTLESTAHREWLSVLASADACAMRPDAAPWAWAFAEREIEGSRCFRPPEIKFPRFRSLSMTTIQVARVAVPERPEKEPPGPGA